MLYKNQNVKKQILIPYKLKINLIQGIISLEILCQVDVVLIKTKRLFEI